MNQSDKVKDGDEQTLRKKWYMALTRYSLLLRNVRTSSKSPRSLQVWHLKTFVVLSLLRRIGRVAARSFKVRSKAFREITGRRRFNRNHRAGNGATLEVEPVRSCRGLRDSAHGICIPHFYLERVLKIV